MEYQDQYKVLCTDLWGHEWVKWIFAHSPSEAADQAVESDPMVDGAEIIGIHKSF